MVLISILSLTSVYAREVANPVLLSVMLSYVMTIQFNLVNVLKTFMTVQSSLVNADRCMKLLDIPQEAELPRNAPNLLKNRP